MEGLNLSKTYSDDILYYFKKQTYPKNFLKNHVIPSELRAKMVDWMIEVLSSYKCS